MFTLVAVLFLLILLGVPLAFAIGLSSAVYIVLYFGVAQLTMVTQRLVAGIDSFSLLALPLFILAGGIMAHGDITSRLLRFARSLVGSISGGLAMVMVFSSMLFGALSGSGTADVAAIGSITLPAMKENNYDMDFSAALLGCAGALATIIPPSIVLIVLGVITETSIAKLFLGGIIPGIITGACLMIYAYSFSVKRGYPRDAGFSLRNVLVSFREAFLALFTAVIIIGGILGGVFTATEAAAVAVGYAFVLAVIVYRKIDARAMLKILIETAEVSAIILLIISCASVFGWVMAAEQIPQALTGFFLSISHNYYVLLILINLLLLVLGVFMETLAIIIIVVPVLMPVVETLKIDPVHFGVMLCLNLAVGANTPPVGIDLLTACRIAGTRLEDASRRVGYMVLAMLVALALVAFIPSLVTFLPNLVMK
jgi:tripartite ATP-independent transporter DctM subunit